MGKTTHGQSGTRIYGIYRAMVQRCVDTKIAGYKYYGGAGISVCEEWNTFDTFFIWANQNGYADNLTIDRKDRYGNYEPSNCQWITQHEQVIRQDRFSHRKEKDKHIIYMDNGKFMVVINKNRRTNHISMHATFDNIEQARVERNIMVFCLENNLEYKYPYFTNDVVGTKKGNRELRKAQHREKIENMLSFGATVREISKKLKIGSLAVWKIKRKIDKQINTQLDKRIEILSRMT